MKLKLYEKLMIWTLSICLVVSFLFLQVRIDFDYLNDINKPKEYNHTIDSERMFKLIDVVTIQPNQEMFEEVEASLIATVMFYVAISVFTSLGAYYTSEFILANSSAFTEWYVDWYNSVPTLEGGQSAEEIVQWEKAHQIPEYLKGTGQLNLDGSLKNPDNIVLPKLYVSNVYSTAEYFLNTYVDSGGIKWKKYSFNDGSSYNMYFPEIQTENIINFTGSYLKLKTTSGTYEILNTSKYSTQILSYEVTPQNYRLQLMIRNKSNGSIMDNRYSRTLTYEEYHTLLNNNGYMVVLQKGTQDKWFLLPLFWQLNYNESFAKGELFDKTTLTDTGSTGTSGSYSGGWFIPSWSFTSSTEIEVVLENGLPSGLDDSDYYNIPIVDDTDNTSNPLPPTPVPVEDWPDYTYNPPTPGTGQVDMDWTDLVNPSTPAPTATPENTLSGGIFQALGDWFVSVFFGAINAMMGFFKALGANLVSMLQSLIDTWTSLIPEGWYENFWTDFADAMIALIIPPNINQRFTDLNVYFETKFGLLIYPIELIFNVFERFATIQPNQCLIFNGYNDPVYGYQIIKPFTFCFYDFAEDNNIEWMFIMLQVFMNALLVYAFAMGWFKSYESIRDQ